MQSENKAKKKIKKLIKRAGVMFLSTGLLLNMSNTNLAQDYGEPYKKGVVKDISEDKQKANAKTTIETEFEDYASALTKNQIMTNVDFETIDKETGLKNIFVPQGICVTDDYILITAYSGNDAYKKELKQYSVYKQNREELQNINEMQNSIIVALDKNTGELVQTLSLPDQNHVGGIAFDGENIYIAKSYDYKISRIKYSRLKFAIENGMDSIKYDKNYDCNMPASFVTYDDGMLWVGTWKRSNLINSNSKLRGFKLENDEMVPVQEYNIPAYCNGATFFKHNGRKMLFLIISKSRVNKSVCKIYNVIQKEDEEDITTSILQPVGEFYGPPQMETACYNDGKIYVNNETVSKLYSGVKGKKATTVGPVFSQLSPVKSVLIAEKNKREKDNQKETAEPEEFVALLPKEIDGDEEKKKRKGDDDREI